MTMSATVSKYVPAEMRLVDNLEERREEKEGSEWNAHKVVGNKYITALHLTISRTIINTKRGERL